MKKCFNVAVRHQGGLVRARRWEIAEQGDGWSLIFSVRQQFAAQNLELCEVVEFSFARKHIEIKHSEGLTGGGIGHQIKLEVVDPFVRRGDLFKFQTKNALVDVEHAVEHLLEREISAQRFRID